MFVEHADNTTNAKALVNNNVSMEIIIENVNTHMVKHIYIKLYENIWFIKLYFYFIMDQKLSQKLN